VQGLAGVPSIPPVDGPWLTFPTTFLRRRRRYQRPAQCACVWARRPVSDIVCGWCRPIRCRGQSAGRMVRRPLWASTCSPRLAELPAMDTAAAITDSAGAFTFYGVPAGSSVARVVKIPYPTGPGADWRLAAGPDRCLYSLTAGRGRTAVRADRALAPWTVPVTVADRAVRDEPCHARGTRVGPRNSTARRLAIVFELLENDGGKARTSQAAGRGSGFRSVHGRRPVRDTEPLAGRYLIRVLPTAEVGRSRA
jgi:hypothetical protein